MPVEIKSLQGRFKFKLQRFQIEEGDKKRETTYFELTNQFQEGYISDRLKEFSSYYSNRLSYKEVEELIQRLTGNRQLSDQKIRGIVVDKAEELSKEIAKEVKKSIDKPMPLLNSKVDIYDPAEEEILILDDGIQVKGQKEKRHSSPVSKKLRINSNIIMLQKKGGGFEYTTGVIDKEGEELVPLEEVVKSKFIEEYGEEKKALNVVAITDGAKDIRVRLLAIFGIGITIILDWYHLVKKLKEHMSMISRNKQEKLKHLKYLLHHLWSGMSEEALRYLKTEVKTKNDKKLEELIRYIEKHREEIIDYGRRREAGKSIGSGRVEKGCDQVIGNRQKKKGMSW
ncbi:MAG: hypothetical protein D6752_06080, partial [Candidatus Nitrosothermus koennekii]